MSTVHLSANATRAIHCRLYCGRKGARRSSGNVSSTQASMARNGSGGMERTGGGYALPPRPSGPTQATHPALLQVFSPDRDKGAEKPYYEQADPSMYTPQSIAARKALSSSILLPPTIDMTTRAGQEHRQHARSRVRKSRHSTRTEASTYVAISFYLHLASRQYAAFLHFCSSCHACKVSIKTTSSWLRAHFKAQHPAVLDAIGRFAALYNADADGRITFHAYKPVHAAITTTLIPDIGMAELADEAIKDWDDDRKEADSLDESRLADSIFEIADHWCPGLDVEEYVSFLDALGDRVRSAL
eukprot:5445468-Pleurochrysis_carterae.AAC.4